MFDMQSEVFKFYKEDVRLDEDTRKKLAGYRDKNIDRLKSGLELLGHPLPAEIKNQGSYPMRTTVQAKDNDYDIDVAVIFEADDLPTSALNSRKRIEEAMIEGGGNFKEPPRARTNAVTVWYQEGHHVDLAIHRITQDVFGNTIYEHGGTDWTERDPQAITDWFIEKISDLSPSKENGATVDSGQLRRIVQLLKFFARSRDSWKFPGGLIISALVVECYVSDYYRDDMSLYKTIEQISARLESDTDVQNPVYFGESLTYKAEYVSEVERFRDQLKIAIEWLEPLVDPNCERLDAAKSWQKFYKHEFWDKLVVEEAEKKQAEINKAREASSLYVTPAGAIATSKSSSEKNIKIKEHRFYGN